MSEPADQASQPVGGFFFVWEKVMARTFDVGVVGAAGAAGRRTADGRVDGRGRPDRKRMSEVPDDQIQCDESRSPARAPLRHDASRRHAARGADRVADRQAQDCPPPRRLRHALHRGRLARLEPQGLRLLRRGARYDLAPRTNRGVRLHAQPGEPGRGRREHPIADRRRHDRHHAGRQDVAAARDRRAGRHLRRKPRDDRRLGEALPRRGPRGDL